MDPLVSVIMLNYNSAKIMDVVKESVSSVKTAGYDNYELLFVDNGSGDGSYEAMSKYVESAGLRSVNIIRSERNLGFTGGNNLGFRERSRESEYTLLLNNDAVLIPGSLKALVKVMDEDDGLGALNGAILDYAGERMIGVPSFIDEMIGVVAPTPSEFHEGKYSAVEETYPMGAAALLRNDAIVEANREDDRIFDEEMFIYYEDTMLGFKLWNAGWRVVFHPVPLARHLGGSSSPGPFAAYHMLRGRAALYAAAPSRYKRLARVYLWRNRLWAERKFQGSGVDFRKAMSEGLTSGYILREKYQLNFYSAPVIRLSAREAITKAFISAGRVGRKKSEALLRALTGRDADQSSKYTLERLIIHAKGDRCGMRTAG